MKLFVTATLVTVFSFLNIAHAQRLDIRDANTVVTYNMLTLSGNSDTYLGTVPIWAGTGQLHIAKNMGEVWNKNIMLGGAIAYGVVGTDEDESNMTDYELQVVADVEILLNSFVGLSISYSQLVTSVAEELSNRFNALDIGTRFHISDDFGTVVNFDIDPFGDTKRFAVGISKYYEDEE